ncbi:MAG: hypothetical protein AAF990_27065 [Bacteroidota bacterium]
MKAFPLFKIALFSMMIFFLASCGKTTSEEMELSPAGIEAESIEIGEDQPQARIVRGGATLRPLLEVDFIDGTTKCGFGIPQDLYGANFVVDPITFNFYYVNQGGVNIEVQTAAGVPVFIKYDAYCLNASSSRTTINDFVCGAVGFESTVSANSNYRLRLTFGAAVSPWYNFTTPNTHPCAN